MRREPIGSYTSASDEPEGSRERHFAEEAHEAAQPRSWWRRWFGFG